VKLRVAQLSGYSRTQLHGCTHSFTPRARSAPNPLAHNTPSPLRCAWGVTRKLLPPDQPLAMQIDGKPIKRCSRGRLERPRHRHARVHSRDPAIINSARAPRLSRRHRHSMSTANQQRCTGWRACRPSSNARAAVDLAHTAPTRLPVMRKDVCNCCISDVWPHDGKSREGLPEVLARARIQPQPKKGSNSIRTGAREGPGDRRNVGAREMAGTQGIGARQGG
jgi:hypothetical protein